MADKSVELRWTGSGLAFEGAGPAGPVVTLDGDGEAGPSPMDAVLLAVGGCMAIDVVMILQKGRIPLEDLSMVVEGDRREDAPRRFTAVRMRYTITGPGDEHRARVERAVQLSRERYCSVLHTLRDDVDVEIEIDLQ